MGIRETLNEKPQITTGIAGGVIAIACLFILYQLLGGGGNAVGQPITELWYTTDDGKTWFAGPAEEIPPFMKDGKEAVRVHIYTCDDGKTKIASYLERYSKDAQKRLKEHRENLKNRPAGGQGGPPPDIGMIQQIVATGVEIKKPNDPNAKWISVMRPEANQLRTVNCPDGQNAEKLRPWFPTDE